MEQLRIFDITSQFLKITKLINKTRLSPQIEYEFIIEERKLFKFFSNSIVDLAIIEKYLDKNKEIKIKFLAICTSEKSLKRNILIFNNNRENRRVRVKEQLINIVGNEYESKIKYIDTYFVYNPYRIKFSIDGDLHKTVYKFLEEKG